MPFNLRSAVLLFSFYLPPLSPASPHGKPDTDTNAGSGGRLSLTTNAARVLQGAFKLYF